MGMHELRECVSFDIQASFLLHVFKSKTIKGTLKAFLVVVIHNFPPAVLLLL